MYLSVEKHKNNLLVQLKGELDHHNTEMVRQKIDKQYFEHRIKNIILDLRGLTFMDSSGIGLVMGRYKNILENGGKIVMVNDNEYVEKILKVSGLLKIINVYPTIEKAMENI
ncbi:MAG: anti-sigma F factor antagonist [Tissierellaceae bacterium]|nr:anti-sigma F factor antagonist [Tissierellaceae bacterium]